jgi:hypothetical protein
MTKKGTFSYLKKVKTYASFANPIYHTGCPLIGGYIYSLKFRHLTFSERITKYERYDTKRKKNGLKLSSKILFELLLYLLCWAYCKKNILCLNPIKI